MRPPEMSQKFITYFRLIDACRRPGCPVCRCVGEDSRRYLDALTYEHVTDVDVRRRLRASWGLCNWHTWMLLEAENAVSGAAILYEDMLRVAIQRLGRGRRGLGGPGPGRLAGRWRRLVRWWRGAGPVVTRLYRARPGCPACARVAEGEAGYLETMLEFVEADGLAQAYAAADGLCLPHLLRAVECAPAHPRAEVLVEQTLPRWEHLRGDLGSFVRKHADGHREAFTEAEAESCTKALAIMAGARAVFGNDLQRPVRPARRGRRERPGAEALARRPRS